ncbi:MAG: hypothetical protein GY863_16905 [bacterium]|nr:hypothetical protein [bacterium]
MKNRKANGKSEAFLKHNDVIYEDEVAYCWKALDRIIVVSKDSMLSRKISRWNEAGDYGDMTYKNGTRHKMFYLPLKKKSNLRKVLREFEHTNGRKK